MRALHHYNERGEKAAAALQTLPGSTPGEQPEGTEGTLQPQLTDADIAAGARICRAAAIEDLLLWLASYEVQSLHSLATALAVTHVLHELCPIPSNYAPCCVMNLNEAKLFSSQLDQAITSIYLGIQYERN